MKAKTYVCAALPLEFALISGRKSMKATRLLWIFWIAAAMASRDGVIAADLGTAFTYQGYLEKPAGTPLTGTCDFRFGLWDASGGGAQKGASPQSKNSLTVSGGVFTVEGLDFGAAATDGTARWLAIEVCCPSPCAPGALTLLTPRVELKPAPH